MLLDKWKLRHCDKIRDFWMFPAAFAVGSSRGSDVQFQVGYCCSLLQLKLSLQKKLAGISLKIGKVIQIFLLVEKSLALLENEIRLEVQHKSWA